MEFGFIGQIHSKYSSLYITVKCDKNESIASFIFIEIVCFNITIDKNQQIKKGLNKMYMMKKRHKQFLLFNTKTMCDKPKTVPTSVIVREQRHKMKTH